jgi:hypothetical protein
VNARVRTAHGVYVVDVEAEEVLELEPEGELEVAPAPSVGLPRLVAAAAVGSTVVAVLDRRPPLAVSHDAGRTWREAGAGLPAGRAVAIAAGDPDRILFGARNRLFLSTDGGRFWRALTIELPEIEAVALD